jgi:endonuclease/exonuclease/phosphatase (EEP) superfamily protein YafD
MKGKRYPLLLIIILTLLTLCPHSHNVNNIVIDIFSHFQIQYALATLILFGFFFFKKRFVQSFFMGILFIINIFPILNTDQKVYARIEHGNIFKVYSANINKDNKDLMPLINDVKRVNADIVLLVEVRARQVEQLTPLIKKYKYKIIDRKMRTSEVGILFLSKFPIVSYNVINLSDYGNGVLETKLVIDQKEILFCGVHIPRHHLNKKFSVRQKMILRVADKISTRSHPVIVAGDFNATPFSPIFKKFLKVSGLKDSRNGFGWQPTWPALLPFLWIPIDHILVSPDIKIHYRETGSYIGSDHFPVIAELSIS